MQKWCVAGLMLCLCYGIASAADVSELDRKIDILSREIEQLKLGEVAGETSVKTGLGPAASKIYSQSKGLSLAGYGEMVYDRYADLKDNGTAGGKNDTIDYLRQVLYLGYKFSDSILMNSEIEFEHGSGGKNGEVSVEFAYLDFLMCPVANFRTGMLLIPVGIYNQIHEPPTFFSVRRPEVEQKMIPTTWRANGAGVFGQLGEQIRYEFYASESLSATGSSGSFDESGIRDGRQEGSKAKMEDIALSGRLDYELQPGSLLGASFFMGGTDQGQTGANVGLLLWDLHSRLKLGQLELRALYANTSLTNASSVTADFAAGTSQYGYYVEAAYDILPHFMPQSEQALMPFVRYEKFNTQAAVLSTVTASAANDKSYLVFGLCYLPHPNVALKVDYQNEILGDNSGVDSMRFASTFMF